MKSCRACFLAPVRLRQAVHAFPLECGGGGVRTCHVTDLRSSQSCAPQQRSEARPRRLHGPALCALGCLCAARGWLRAQHADVLRKGAARLHAGHCSVAARSGAQNIAPTASPRAASATSASVVRTAACLTRCGKRRAADVLHARGARRRALTLVVPFAAARRVPGLPHPSAARLPLQSAVGRRVSAE